jgi:glycosyltransferase involved in cell wall biosynthesis
MECTAVQEPTVAPPREAHRLVAPALLSVIIPAYNVAGTIGDQLEALAAQECPLPWEVIVADNGSTDGTGAAAERHRGRLPGLRVVDASARRGSAYARNVGARHAAGDLLIFLDADDIAAPGFLAAMAAALERHEFAAPRIEALSLNGERGAQLGQHPQFYGPMRYYNPPYLYHVSGCGMALRRALFERLGGFDEGMLRLQDSELCFRAQRAGATIGFVPAAVVRGRNRRSLAQIMRQSYGWGQAEVELVSRYRSVGRPGALLLWARYGARWGKLLLRALTLRSARDVNRWGQEVARNLGVLRAALALRKPPV